MDIIWLLQILVKPFFYLLFLFLFLQFFIKPLFNYLAVGKVLREQKELQKEYLAHKNKIKEARVKARENGYEKPHKA